MTDQCIATLQRGSKTLFQQNPLTFNWACWLTQITHSIKLFIKKAIHSKTAI